AGIELEGRSRGSDVPTSLANGFAYLARLQPGDAFGIPPEKVRETPKEDTPFRRLHAGPGSAKGPPGSCHRGVDVLAGATRTARDHPLRGRVYHFDPGAYVRAELVVNER